MSIGDIIDDNDWIFDIIDKNILLKEWFIKFEIKILLNI
jgi:hypothetical protein